MPKTKLVSGYIATTPQKGRRIAASQFRSFAVSIDLSEDFDGGEVVFPKYGARGYRPAAGGAVGFSCSLLCAVTQVTRGRRYVFLPFLYDDAAAQIPEQNTQFVEEP